MPAFTSTTENGTVIASILMVGAMQEFFDYECHIECGLPSVTLLGQKTDWELDLRRLGKLNALREEPGQFCRLLKPVVSSFVESFDDLKSEETTAFWQRIAHYCPGAFGPHTIQTGLRLSASGTTSVSHRTTRSHGKAPNGCTSMECLTTQSALAKCRQGTHQSR